MNQHEHELLTNLFSFFKEKYKNQSFSWIEEKFCGRAMSLVEDGDISQETLDVFLSEEGIEKTVKKKKRKFTDQNNPIRNIDPCSSGSSYKSHC